jgi:hypothetical protein
MDLALVKESIEELPQEFTNMKEYLENVVIELIQ